MNGFAGAMQNNGQQPNPLAAAAAVPQTAGDASIFHSLTSNPMFAGGIGLAAVGVGTAFLRKGSQFGIMWAKRNFLTSLEVTSRDKAYPWVLNWLQAQGSKSRNLSLETASVSKLDGSTKTAFTFVPGPGRHMFTYKGTILMVDRKREKQMVDFQTGSPWESITLVHLGTNTSILENFLAEAEQASTLEEEGMTVVYTNWGPQEGWKPFGHPRRKRPLESVVLDQGLSEFIVKDLSEFLSRPQWYTERGIPYRRGYLLYGPPGSGKSSFIQALAGHFDFNICMLSLADNGLTDDRLAQILSLVPQRSIVLLEDVDVAFVKRTADPADKHQRYYNQVTTSGLLNILDGLMASEQRILFMTTNHKERLDPALIRPGRVDIEVPVGNASKYQIVRMFETFYPNAKERASEFWDAVSDKTLSMAHLQGYFLMFKDDPSGAISEARELLAKYISEVEKK